MLRRCGQIEPGACDRNIGLIILSFQTRRVREWWPARRDFNHDPAAGLSSTPWPTGLKTPA